MSERRRRRAAVPVVVLVALVAAVSAACSPGASGAPSPGASASAGAGDASRGPVSLAVFAAASLKAGLARAAEAYGAGHPDVVILLSTDSSAALETKIEQGAPADVFLSADTANPKKLVDAGLAAGGMTAFARNRLVVVVPAANPARIASPLDLASAGVKVVACADSVPIARYTAALLANLSKAPGYPPDFAARVTANVVSREDNVGALVAKIALGEGDAGVVYATDAVAAGAKVATVAIPDAANVTATYGGVVLKASANADAAAAFLAWLAGPEGRAILAGFGFLAPA